MNHLSDLVLETNFLLKTLKNFIDKILLAIQVLPFEVIDQKFLERGHTHMPVDNIHGLIEVQASAVAQDGIHGPTDWEEKVFVKAAKKHPLRVRRINFRDILDWPTIAKILIKYKARLADGSSVLLSRAKWIWFIKSQPFVVFVKYDFSQDEFLTWKLSGALGRPRTTPLIQNLWKIIDRKKYEISLPISPKKKKDLIEMCKNGIIHQAWHSFYQSLSVDKNVLDSDTHSDLRDEEHFSSSSDDSSSSEPEDDEEQN